MTVFVVTGTDTGVGKTVTTAALATALVAEGRGVAVYKPVQAGTENGEGDIDVVRRLSGLAAVHEGVRLREPMAPVAAAAREAVRLPPMSAHAAAVEQLAAQHDDVLVEGAGGLLVELDHSGATVADLAVALSAPTIVVCRSGLGTLNHTALTLEALARRGAALAGLVIGAWPQRPAETDLDNRGRLARTAPVVGCLPAAAGLLPGDRFRQRAPRWLPSAGISEAVKTVPHSG